MPKIVDAHARRQEVVEAVLRIIAVDGLERASLREVADEAGLAVGSVRHYFANSDELLAYSFATVVDRIVARLRDGMPHLAAAAHGSSGQRAAVLALLGGALPLDEARALDVCAWLAFRNAARIRPFLAPVADRSHREVAAIIGQVVATLVPADEAEDNVVLEAERLLATLDGLCLHALLHPGWITAEMVDGVLERHLNGLGARGR
ncbi:TetR/AcrR family transcriptional regulator [Arthrobacter nitrophenolicus]|uniref:TetR family transcriptional regulator n=1 Tax=Arthrobacter nitrophenolicus TaxID=683150 RepID=A0A4R5YDV0_9MICC|nr:TetR family transcriptional regulator C-terminal domain-containing protein [Arthrobacter nitrophenolicus]TDL41475.1 TetR family transcriptional regulator [Arthrobacter nitrophenolicus]